MNRMSPPRRRSCYAIECGDDTLHSVLLHVERRRARARRRLRRVELQPSNVEPKRNSVAASAVRTLNEGAKTQAKGAPGAVLSLLRVSNDLLRFTIAKPPGFSHTPGQSVRLEIGGVRRRYTIASAPHEPDLEFFVELVPGGRMSRRFAALQTGDRLMLEDGPRDGISLDERARRHLMLATVTGVNPFVSILRHAVQRGRRGLGAVLVHGARFADEFGYLEELERLAAERPDVLVYVPTVSGPAESRRNTGWQGATGRTDASIGEIVARFQLTPHDTTVYACGNPGMVDSARGRMSGLGYKVRGERFA